MIHWLEDFRRKLIHLCLFFLIMTAFVTFLLPESGAGEPANFIGIDNPDIPWNIVAQELEYDHQNKVYTAIGSVDIRKEGRRISADRASFDHVNMLITAAGHVILATDADILTGDRLELDLKNETGSLYGGSLFLSEKNFHIKGDRINKVSKDSYTALNASLTTCDSKTPDWKITARKIRVTVEGYGMVTGGALYAKKVPVLYMPFLVFPVKRKRSTGLLPPQTGYSERKGAEYNQPFYWAMNDWSDATAYLHHMGKRGNKFGMEYRYAISEESRGALMFDFLEDRHVDDGTPGSTDDWGYAEDKYHRPNSDRYWFRFKHDQKLPLGFVSKLDLDIVSDQDYLPEFRDGYTGYNNSADYYMKTFGRQLDDYNDPVRVNRLGLGRNWPGWTFNTDVRWYDDITKGRWEETDDTLHKLPVITGSAIRQQLPKTPLYWSMDGEYNRFYRKDGNRGHRQDLYSKIFWPMYFKPGFAVEPSMGFRQTFWQMDRSGLDDKMMDDRYKHREMIDLNLDMSTKFYRIFAPAMAKGRKIRHTIRPAVAYDFIGEVDQDDYPYFDSDDRIEKNNRFQYSFTSLFEMSGADNKQAFRRVLRLKLEQDYDINEANETDPTMWTDPNEKRPFSPIEGTIDWWPSDWLTFGADGKWSVYNSRFNTRNVSVALNNKRGDSFFCEYRYTIDASESFFTNIALKISKRISLHADYEKNMADSKDIRTGLGFLYRTQCWSTNFAYTDKADEGVSYVFMIRLFGLGGIGSNK